ncbi:MAG: hypothetical protein IKO49_00035 [Bacilli bacterium]|nr:hypothetical protein [Bacilli bacterium]
MKQLSILDKFKVVLDITMSNKILLIIMMLLLFFSILMINRKNVKRSKIIYGLIYVILIITIIVKYYSSLSVMYDSMMDNLFIVFYFPNISVYVAAIIVTNIIMWVSMFSSKTKRITKVVNSFVFFLLHYILILVLNVVAHNKLDVFDSVSLYRNANIHSLIELSSNIFVIWIVYLVLYKIISSYLENKEYKTVKQTVTVKTVKNTYNTSFSALSNYISTLDAPMIVKRDRGLNVQKINAPIVVKKDSFINNELNRSINILSVPYVVRREEVKNNKLDKSINILSVPYVVRREEVKNNKLDKSINILSVPYVVRRDDKLNNFIPSGISLLKSPVLVKREQTKIIYATPFNKNTSIPETDFSSKDYKEVLDMLHKQDQKSILDKEEELRIEKENQDKLSQLMELYSII